MRRAVGSLVVGVLVAGCGGGSDTGADASAAPTASKAVERTSLDGTSVDTYLVSDGSRLSLLSTPSPGTGGAPLRTAVAVDATGGTYMLDAGSDGQLARLTATATGETVTYVVTPGERTEVRVFGADGSFAQGAVLFSRDGRLWAGRLASQAFTGYDALTNVTDVSSRTTAARPAAWTLASTARALFGLRSAYAKTPDQPLLTGIAITRDLVAPVIVAGHLVSPVTDAIRFAPAARVGRIGSLAAGIAKADDAVVVSPGADAVARTVADLQRGTAPIGSDGTYVGTVENLRCLQGATASSTGGIELRLSDASNRLSGIAYTPSSIAWSVGGTRVGNALRLVLDGPRSFYQLPMTAVVSADGRTLSGVYKDADCLLPFRASYVPGRTPAPTN